ncbi:MAG: hypothetical protein EOM51_05030 [Clostridia bacterium]|nr:hypothetical protein [Clostridia bacterium]
MRIKKLYLPCAILLAAVFLFSIGNLGALALELGDNPTVTLVAGGGSVAFTFNRSDGNLFDSFAGIMPGDSLMQTITVKSAAGNSGSFKIYLRAEPAVESSDNFADEFTLKVFDGASELNLLSGDSSLGVLLGTFSPGSSKDLTVSLTVPLSMDNSFQGARSLVNWHFYAEEVYYYDPPPPSPSIFPSPSPSPSPSDSPAPSPSSTPVPSSSPSISPSPGNPDYPQTGDNSHTLLWVLLMIGSGTALTLLLTFGNKHKSKEK